MLKAIELYGFKSFVDKTRFEFPPGITVIVGPNGSGKSNVVDAIKWVLGEQSAKSLRGKEMADVIFKGSGSGRRKPANSAEATIIFDNSERRIEWDEDEVHVTRRVYRSGEGEYLINGQACRLRDIKDLFRGTGVGADAYSLIEQGKVDTVLQASPRERRAIFEEAAGISRFKAKKVESQRRLERVEQNLIRLGDIVDEVSGRLKRLKSQAGKARRYDEYTSRLQSLRTQVGQVDWQRLGAELAELQDGMATVGLEADQRSSELTDLEARSRAIEDRSAEAMQELRTIELGTSSLRERIAGNKSVMDSERDRITELQDELAQHRGQLAALEVRSGDLDAQLENVERALASAIKQHAANKEVLEQRQQALTECHARLTTAQQESEQLRQRFVEAMRESASLGTEISASESAENNARQAMERMVEAVASLATALAAASTHLEGVTADEAALASSLADLDERLRRERASLDARATELEEVSDATAGLKQREIALRERAGVLEEIESRMEGIGTGVQEVLKQARSPDAGPLAGVRGMVADLIHVTDPTMAELVDVALGERAQHLVVAGTRLFQHLEESSLEVPGRVGFVRLQSTAPPLTSRHDLTSQSGVLGPAIDFVRTTDEYAQLLKWLLGDTWFVETISDAIQLGRSIAAPLKFVTRGGELLDRDGRLVVGPHASALGLMSRRTELRELQARIEASREQLTEAERRQAEVQAAQQSQQIQLAELRQQRNETAEALSSSRATLASATEKVTGLQHQHTMAEQDRVDQDAKAAEHQAQLASARSRLSKLEGEIKALEKEIASRRDVIEREQQQLETLRVAANEAEVANARSEQESEQLTTRRGQLNAEKTERSEAIDRERQQADRCDQRLEAAQLAILHASAENAELALQIEAEQSKVAEQTAQLEALRAERQQAADNAAQTRDALRGLEQQLHRAELEAERVRHERGNLAERLHEDYGITTDDLQRELTAEEQAARAQVDAEIEDLRTKLSSLGAVNMDALAELQELEGRHTGLDEQYRDLIESKEALERIIHKIDADSRRLFTETLEAIRANFGVLFRKVFGGGRADIVLDEGVDILESGIDIVATPPGKQSLGLSLLSGGERALTAVTLLMAVFQYRPSPFCVLDEVDGPLDEANIGRFVDVLNEFLAWTKFVVVTHSKKTMTTAHTLYGVTMQESGVSKRVSVRFEEVGEHGVISEEAIRRAEEDAA